MNKTATAIGVTGLGFLILWSGITNAGVLSTAQSLFMGHAPIPGTPQAKVFGSATGTGISLNTPSTSAIGGIAGTALQYNGTPYIWGGHDPSGWDCYGFLTYVLHHDLAYNLPNNTHSGYLEFMAWNGAYVIDKAQVQAGDLVIWPTHSGIAVSPTEMISAENPSRGTRVDTFSNGGPLLPEPMTFLRVKGNTVSA